MKKIMTVLLIAAFVCIGFGTAYADDYGSYVTKIFTKQGGDSLFAKSGGQISILSGGVLDILSGGYLKVAGTAVTASAAELNYIDGTTLGTAIASKALGLGTTRNVNYIAVNDTVLIDSAVARVNTGSTLQIDSGATFTIGGTTVSSTADKLNGIMTATAIVADTVALSATDAYGKIFYALPLAGKAKRTLPSAAAGLNIEFMVADADSLLISAATGDSLITSAGAAWKTTSSVAGTVRLIAIDATRWLMQYSIGTWTSY